MINCGQFKQSFKPNHNWLIINVVTESRTLEMDDIVLYGYSQYFNQNQALAIERDNSDNDKGVA